MMARRKCKSKSFDFAALTQDDTSKGAGIIA